jgi:hypothetical protein
MVGQSHDSFTPLSVNGRDVISVLSAGHSSAAHAQVTNRKSKHSEANLGVKWHVFLDHE